MSQAITTKRTESGYVARAAAGSVKYPRDYSLNEDDNHKAAAIKLIRKMEWFYGEWIGGCDHAGNYVWTYNHVKDASERITMNESIGGVKQ